MTAQLVDEQARTILCPRCEEAQPMRDFATLGMSPIYAWALSPIYRCKQCNHLFAPRVQLQAAFDMVGSGSPA